MDDSWLSPLRSVLSTPWFARIGIAVAAVYLGVFLWKILRSEEGFLFGYGNWVVGKWRTLRGIKAAESVEDTEGQPVRTLGVSTASPVAVTDSPSPGTAAGPGRQLDAKDRVLTLSRVLDGDLGHILMSNPADWEAQIERDWQTIVSGVTRVVNDPERCRCGFFILDDDEQNLILAVGEGYNKARRPKLAIEPSCAGHAFITGENYYCRDIATDPVYWHSEHNKKDFRSIACVPVRAGGSIFGVLCLDAHEPNAFTDVDFAHLEVFAVKLAVFCALHVLRASGVRLLETGEESRS